jgi:hypothetical protein
VTAIALSSAKISWMLAVSHFDPSDTKISSGATVALCATRWRAMASSRKS